MNNSKNVKRRHVPSIKMVWDSFTDKYGRTIFHPQFLILRFQNQVVDELNKSAEKGMKLIDLGCGRMLYKSYVENLGMNYTSLDSREGSRHYNNKPDIYADLDEKLPIKSDSYNVALLLQVVQYLIKPEQAFSEMNRILKPNGLLYLTALFMYPLNDIPLDRNRFSSRRLEEFLKSSGFRIKKTISQVSFFDFLFLSINVYLSKLIFDLLKSRSLKSGIFLLLLLIATPPVILINNLLALALNQLQSKRPSYYPINYLIIAIKK